MSRSSFSFLYRDAFKEQFFVAAGFTLKVSRWGGSRTAPTASLHFRGWLISSTLDV
jgi:hypothetical protein